MGALMIYCQTKSFAQQAQSNYSQFQQQAQTYQADLSKRVQDIDNDEFFMKQRFVALSKETKNIKSQLNRSKIFSEIDKCRQAVAHDEEQKQLAHSYLFQTNQYLLKLKADAQVEAHNLSEDREKTAEDASKAKELQAQESWHKQVLAISKHNRELNETPVYYGSGVRGRGHSYRHGHFNGYRYAAPRQAASAPTMRASHSAGHHR